MNKLLSIGNNKKLGKTVAIFNLPARKTCPGATTYCGKVCYAMKAERMYKGAREMRERNYQASLGPDFIGDMMMELAEFKGSKVRIHESGDFYDQAYLNKWIAIVSNFPDIIFLAYTKMYDRLDFRGIPGNLVVYASYDPTTLDKMGTQPSELHECVIEDAPIVHAPGTVFTQGRTDFWYRCDPVSKGHHNYCGVSCNVCWERTNNVIFQKH